MYSVWSLACSLISFLMAFFFFLRRFLRSSSVRFGSSSEEEEVVVEEDGDLLCLRPLRPLGPAEGTVRVSACAVLLWWPSLFPGSKFWGESPVLLCRGCWVTPVLSASLALTFSIPELPLDLDFLSKAAALMSSSGLWAYSE